MGLLGVGACALLLHLPNLCHIGLLLVCVWLRGVAGGDGASCLPFWLSLCCRVVGVGVVAVGVVVVGVAVVVVVVFGIVGGGGFCFVVGG